MQKILTACAVTLLCIANLSCQQKDGNQGIGEMVKIVNLYGKNWLKMWKRGQLTNADLVKTFQGEIVFKLSMDVDSSMSSSFMKIYSNSNQKDYVDIYSGSFFWDTIQNQVEFLGEPESTIKLYFNNHFSNILTYGSSTSFHDAFWMATDKFIVIGSRLNVDNTSTPVIWFFNLTTNQYCIYDASAMKKVIDDKYIRQKFLIIHP